MTKNFCKKHKNKEEKGYLHRERRISSMQRSIYLADAGEEGLEAKMDNGVLRIVVPKTQLKEKSRRIEIQ